MRLTNYGKRFVRVTGAILCALVFVLGAIVCLFELAYTFKFNQKAYNVLFIVVLMPLCVIGGRELLRLNKKNDTPLSVH